MIVCLASDHNGVALKAKIKEMLKRDGHDCIDVGTYISDLSVDYTDYAHLVGNLIQHGDCDRAILICGTGIGMSIVANRYSKVRAAVVHNFETVGKCREHNDANVLCLGSWIRTDEDNIELAYKWLGENFGQLRHVRRVERISPEPQGKVVFANGVFDILHQGHLSLLSWSKNLGDKLVVGINSDSSVKLLKGEGRPINNQDNRKALLQALRFVDEVIIFNDIKPIELIKSLHPAIVVKGGEWLADEVRERDGIPEGIDVKIFPLVQGYSTTNVVKQISEQAIASTHLRSY